MSVDAEVVVVVRAIAESRDRYGIEVNLSTDLFEELQLDSLEFAELFSTLDMRLETNAFEAGSVISQVRTVGDLADLYRRLIATNETTALQ